MDIRTRNRIKIGAILGALAGLLILAVLTLFPPITWLALLAATMLFATPIYCVVFLLTGLVLAGIGAGVGYAVGAGRCKA